MGKKSKRKTYTQKKLKEEARFITHLLQAQILRIASQSRAIHASAKQQYDVVGRGAYFVGFDTTEDLTNDAARCALIYTPMQDIAEMGYSRATTLCADYDPNDYFVLLAVLHRRGNGNMLTTAAHINYNCQDGLEHTAPCIVDQMSVGTDLPKLASGSTVSYHKATCTLTSCSNTEGLQPCSSCGVYRYCSTECCEMDEPYHKELCKAIQRK